jgi:hypothetical protein
MTAARLPLAHERGNQRRQRAARGDHDVGRAAWTAAPHLHMRDGTNRESDYLHDLGSSLADRDLPQFKNQSFLKHLDHRVLTLLRVTANGWAADDLLTPRVQRIC